MSDFSEWPCWKIMKCPADCGCPARSSTDVDLPCWEIIGSIDFCSWNICRDCLVLVIKQKNSVLSSDDVARIVSSKHFFTNGKEHPRNT